MGVYSGYNQIPIHIPDQEHTSFIIDRDLYYYKVMPFGLKNTGVTYQGLVNMMFEEEIRKNDGGIYRRHARQVQDCLRSRHALSQYAQYPQNVSHEAESIQVHIR